MTSPTGIPTPLECAADSATPSSRPSPSAPTRTDSGVDSIDPAERLVSLPYYAPNPPAPLPTDVEIDAAPDVSMEYGGRRVVEVGHHFVVKFGEGVDLTEGKNMMFVRERTKVPLPAVYALFHKAGKNYIIMERIAGQPLSSLWSQLHLLEKQSIVRTLRSYFSELRSLPRTDYYGSLGRRSLLDGIFWTEEQEPAINGPFASEEAFTEALALKYTYDGRSRYRADFYRQCLPRVLRGNHPIFTHGDYQRKNIMVQRLDNHLESPHLSTWQIHILDWEKSGWYPTYWEYAIATCALQWNDDWCLWIQEALDPYPSEAAWLQTIRLELWS